MKTMTPLSRRGVRVAFLTAFLLLPLAAYRFGGWAVVTVDDLPDYVPAGQPITLGFTVRQHGVTLLSDLKPTVEARGAGADVTASGKPGSTAGHYTATITFPKAGAWNVVINSGFGSSRAKLLPLEAVDPRGTPPAAIAERERGRRLFVAKGCVTCHVHDEVSRDVNFSVGPDLTGRRWPAVYLAKFLADPSIAQLPPGTSNRMPNLGLAPREITALVTFVNTDRQVSKR